MPDDTLQRCRSTDGVTECITGGDGAGGTVAKAVSHYLGSTLPVPSRAPEVRALANTIGGDIPNHREQVQSVIEWIRNNIDQVPVDVFSALDVLANKKAECQGNTYLYAALARALGIPTRVVNGIVY